MNLILLRKISNHIFASICLIGFIGNILAIIVFSRKKYAKTIFSTYFRVLSIFDTLTILTRIDYFILVNQSQPLRLISNITCKFSLYFVYFMPASSTWILVLISLDRFVSICKPSWKYLIRNNPKYQLLACLCVVMYNFVFYIPFFVFQNINNTTYPSIDGNRTIDCINDTETIIDIVDTFNATLIPFIIMLSCTIFILRTIFKSRNNANTTSNKIRDIRFAITSIGLNLSFLILTFPQNIFMIFFMIFDLEYFLKYFIFGLITCLAYTNFSIIFYITLLVNSNFRKEFYAFILDLKKNISR